MSCYMNELLYEWTLKNSKQIIYMFATSTISVRTWQRLCLRKNKLKQKEWKLGHGMWKIPNKYSSHS